MPTNFTSFYILFFTFFEMTRLNS